MESTTPSATPLGQSSSLEEAAGSLPEINSTPCSAVTVVAAGTRTSGADTLTFCPIAQALSVARLNSKMKGFRQILREANNTNKQFQKMQEEFDELEQELAETRHKLLEKNDELVVVLEERRKYVSLIKEEQEKQKKIIKELKNAAELELISTLQDQIISGYKDQIQGLQKELEKGKQKLRDASLASKDAEAETEMSEKALTKLLKDYVIPQIKNPDRRLQSLIRRYVPDAPKGDTGESSQDQGELSDDDDDQ